MTIDKNMVIGLLLILAFISCTGVFLVAIVQVLAIKQYTLLFAVAALYLSAAAALGFIVGILGDKSRKV